MARSAHFRGRERSVRNDPNAIMSRAWAIFRETYSFPAVPFASIGRHCFAWALRKAWTEAQFASKLTAMSDDALAARIASIQAEIDALQYRGFSINITQLRDELKDEARPYVAEQFRRAVAAPVLKLAA